MIDWKEIGERAGADLSEYLKIASVNPPGDEGPAAEFIAGKMGGLGLESRRFQSAPNRFNLVARMPGNGGKAPILLYHHMDVVAADSERWSCDPFGGEIRGGSVYGRGAIDMKGMGIIQMQAIALLQKHMPERSRDIIFFAAADEETGGRFGTEWMVENHWKEIEAEYVWDEGGFGLRDLFGPSPVFNVAVAEKRELWIKLIAHGEPGHGGMPHGQNAAEILADALQRLRKMKKRYALHPITETMFRKISGCMPFPRSFLLKHLGNPLIFRLLRKSLSEEPTLNAMIRNTLSLTMLDAGVKVNVIPEEAEAVLDIRLLPDGDVRVFLREFENLIDDARVEIKILQTPQETTVSPDDSEFFRTLERVILQEIPDGVVAPMVSPGTTDSCFFRRKGVSSYGLFPAVLTPDEFAGFHGRDERISIENLILGTRITYEVLKAMCA